MSRFRRMGDASFRAVQHERKYDPHVESVNRLVDRLRGGTRGWMPHVDPGYGGVNAEILFLFQDPGPGTDDRLGAGSGFLSAENDDPSAELLSECMEAAGLEPGQVITWNAYPWALPKGRNAPTAADLEIGAHTFTKLLDLLPRIKLIIAAGRAAQDGWKRFAKLYPWKAQEYRVLHMLHTSGRGVTNGGQHTKAEGVDKIVAVMRNAKELVEPGPPVADQAGS